MNFTTRDVSSAPDHVSACEVRCEADRLRGSRGATVDGNDRGRQRDLFARTHRSLMEDIVGRVHASSDLGRGDGRGYRAVPHHELPLRTDRVQGVCHESAHGVIQLRALIRHAR